VKEKKHRRGGGKEQTGYMDKYRVKLTRISKPGGNISRTTRIIYMMSFGHCFRHDCKNTSLRGLSI
jgi:hypothetical protein